MTFATRFVSLIGVASCAVMLAACGELFSARTQAADGSAASDANAGVTTPGNTNNATPGNTNTATPGNTNTATPGNTNTATPGNTNTATPGNTNTTTPTTTAPDPSTSVAVTNKCAQKSAGYATDAKAIITASCATSNCHVSGKVSPNMASAAGAQSALTNGGLDRVVNGSMPAGTATITSAGKCILYNWADYGYLP